MAAKLQHDDELTENHEINVTPFIDVMLVLLIIFMVAAPLATVDIKVDLPASAAEPQPKPDKPLYLTIEADHSLSLGNAPVTLDSLPRALSTATDGDTEQRLFLRADKTVDYETLMQTMNKQQEARYLKLPLDGLEGVPSEGGAVAGGTPQ
ncbi:MAG: TonB system transport protein ExbD [Parahaliea sp.]